MRACVRPSVRAFWGGFWAPLPTGFRDLGLSEGFNFGLSEGCYGVVRLAGVGGWLLGCSHERLVSLDLGLAEGCLIALRTQEPRYSRKEPRIWGVEPTPKCTRNQGIVVGTKIHPDSNIIKLFTKTGWSRMTTWIPHFFDLTFLSWHVFFRILGGARTPLPAPLTAFPFPLQL